MTSANGNGNGNGSNPKIGTDVVKCGLAQMLKGGVIVSAHFYTPWRLTFLCFDGQDEPKFGVLLTHHSKELIAKVFLPTSTVKCDAAQSEVLTLMGFPTHTMNHNTTEANNYAILK